MALTQVQPGMLASDSQYTGFKNRIINGAMVIDQRNAGGNSVAVGYTVDRWNYLASQTNKGTWGQNFASATPPVGFTNYLGFQTGGSAYSVAAGDYFVFRQLIEGFNTADLGWGTANAKAVTLSFWVQSSLTGTFGGAFENYNGTRNYAFSYSIPTANTWTYITITVAGDTTGTWQTNNGIGMQVMFGLGAGSSVSGSTGSWSSTQYFSATGAVSVVGTASATFYLTGVQLEKGSTATSFDYRPYGTELQLCQRYCQKVMPGLQLCKMRELDRSRQGHYTFPVTMRTTATVAAMATTDSISATIANQSDRGFSAYLTVPGDGYGAQIDTQALVTAEL
jgi:hypothetical protein